MRRIAFRLVWLLAVWLALWERVDVITVTSGLIVAGGILLLFPLPPMDTGGTIRLIPLIRFLGYFAWKLVEATLVVAWEVITPRSRITEGIVAVPIVGVSDLLTTTVANTYSLTPGTLTIDLDEDPTVLYVHVLHLRDVADVRRDVHTLERYIIHAFGSRQAVAAVDAAYATPLPEADRS